MSTSMLEPAEILLRRVRADLSAEFDAAKPIRISRAPGRLDVMGGIAEYTGSMVAQATLDRAATLALQERSDRAVQIFSFDQLDEHLPFTLRIPLESLATQPIQKLKQELSEPGRHWAAQIAGCLTVLHEAGFVNLADPVHAGLNLAVFSTIPPGVGGGSSSAMEVSAMMNLVEHFHIRHQLDPLKMAILCQQVQERMVGESRGIAAAMTSCFGQPGSLLRMITQPHETQAPLPLPTGVQVIGINSGVKRIDNGLYERTRISAWMAHTIILHRMKLMGQAASRELIGDPMRGYLANLDPEDYKRTFREHLPENISGRDFLDRFCPMVVTTSPIQPDQNYPVQHAADHHVLEARRVKRFLEFLESAAEAEGSARKLWLDKAGHLMYASHLSYTNDAMLGTDECDLLVQLVRDRKKAGFYGARITAGGGGGVVAVLAEQSPTADSGIAEILDIYEKQTGKKARAFVGSSPGAWHIAPGLVKLP